jgi:hypothetical protein
MWQQFLEWGEREISWGGFHLECQVWGHEASHYGTALLVDQDHEAAASMRSACPDCTVRLLVEVVLHTSKGEGQLLCPFGPEGQSLDL